MKYYNIAAIFLTIASISFIAFVILSPELRTGLQPMQIVKELDQDEIDFAYRVLDLCTFEVDDYNRLKEIVVEADKTRNSDKDPIKAEAIYSPIRKELRDCQYQDVDFIPYSTTQIGFLHMIFTAIMSIIGTVFGVLGFIQARKNKPKK